MSDDTPGQCIVRDIYANVWGPFENGVEASKWAKRKWPDQEQDGDNVVGWDITPLLPPD